MFKCAKITCYLCKGQRWVQYDEGLKEPCEVCNPISPNEKDNEEEQIRD